jgi:hypothetical protein
MDFVFHFILLVNYSCHYYHHHHIINRVGHDWIYWYVGIKWCPLYEPLMIDEGNSC